MVDCRGLLTAHRVGGTYLFPCILKLSRVRGHGMDIIRFLDSNTHVFRKIANALSPQCHTPDSSRLCSSSTAWRSQLIVDLAWRPVFYNPGILIALTVTWDCFMNLSKAGKKEKEKTLCATIQVIENPLVMPAEHNLRNDTEVYQPNHIPLKEDVCALSEFSKLPEEAHKKIN